MREFRRARWRRELAGRDNVPGPVQSGGPRRRDHGEERLRRDIRAVDEGPGGLLGRGRRQTSTGTGAGTGCFDDSRRPFYRWFVGGELNTCYNALDLHVDRGARQAAGARSTTARSPGRCGRTPTASSATRSRLCAGMLRRSGRREGRPRDHLHADGARGRDRDARVRAPRRDPLGGLRRLRRQRAGQADRRRQAQG